MIAPLLSLGYDLTQPLLAGIVNDLSPPLRPSSGVECLYIVLGFGTGSLIFGGMLSLGFETVFLVFGVVAVLAGVFAAKLFKSESHK